MGSTLGQSTAQFTLAGLTLLLAGLAQAQFGPQVNILGQDPELPEEAVTADLDGDGLDDILFTSNGDGTIGWYRNLDGAGTYGALRSIRQGPQHSVITAADLDGDGDTDVLTAESIGNRVIWIENENGDGSLWTARVIGFSFDGLSDPTDVAAADYDLDGDIDVFAVHNNSSDRDGRVGVYTNNGFADPSFQQQRIAIVGRFPTDIKLADLSGNGRPDILLSADVGDRVTWIPNNPEGFGAPIDISASQDRPQSVAAADLDGDGDLDVVASSIGDNVVAWYANNLNTATPGFGGLQFIANGPAAPLSIDAGDLDGDGDPDIVVAGSSGNVVTWHENQLDTATPGFNVNRSVSGPLTRPQSVFIANLDGDGRCDKFVEIDQVPVRTWRKCAVQVEFGAGPPADRDRWGEPPLPVRRDRGSARRCPDDLQGGSGSVESIGRHEQVDVHRDSLVRFGEQAGDRRPLQEAGGDVGIDEDPHRLERGGVEQPCMGQRPLMRLDDDLGSIDLHLAGPHGRQ